MNYLAALLVLLLTAPAMAQVVPSPFGGNAGGGGGGGGGTVTSVATTSPITGGTITTTGTIACATCLSTSNFFNSATLSGVTNNLILSINGSGNVFQGTPAGTAGAGSIGYNSHGNVEVIADGSALSSTLFVGQGADFTIHDSVNENNWQFLIYNDDDGISNAVALNNYGTSPTNILRFHFGDGAGSFKTPVAFGTSGFAFDMAGTAAVTQASVAGYFVVYNNNILDPLSIGTKNLGVFHHDGTTAVTQFSASNNAGTAAGGVKSQIVGNSASSTHMVVTMEAMDSVDDVSLNLLSPTANNGTQAALVLSSITTTAGNQAWLQFNTPENNGHGVAIAAPNTVGAGFIKFLLPGAFPAANGQPLVSTTAGVMSFAAGKTQAYVLCTGAACATSCTLTFTGGILTANSGTCP